MKIDIQSQRENPLLHRKEVRFSATYIGAVPSVKDVRAGIVAALHSKDNLTIIDGMGQSYGEKKISGYAKVYADEKAMKIEPKQRVKKNFAVKEEKKAEAPKAEAPKAEAPKAAAPVEEKK
jgi:small subunit ribosomal protein S24e